MMNYIALHVVNAVIKTVSGSYKTEKIQETASFRSEFLIESNGLFNTSLWYISCACNGCRHVVHT